ncbi:hypothetical protein H0H92_007856 [Tricholoma furcatifolium]|nr:hypothetical protein H0H92_007856 [Tricholoma furcatifolium]
MSYRIVTQVCSTRTSRCIVRECGTGDGVIPMLAHPSLLRRVVDAHLGAQCTRAHALHAVNAAYDLPATATITAEEMKARSLVEKKTIINLLEAFAVSVKHYLRGEDGIYYEDLYYLVKFLPAYAFPPSIPSDTDAKSSEAHGADPSSPGSSSFLPRRTSVNDPALSPTLPVPATSPRARKTSFLSPVKEKHDHLSLFHSHSHSHHARTPSKEKMILARGDEGFLLPARDPPRYHLFDLFPFSLLVRCLTKRGAALKGKKAAKLRAKMRQNTISHNLPLEISLYLNRKQTDVPTISTSLGLSPEASILLYIQRLTGRADALVAALNQLVDALTGLERILTTPIPFSYSIHLWVVTLIYCLVLPFQIWSYLKWLTIPSTVIISFMFFGFLVAGEEIENPFGYDKNDLNLDHFTHNIIRNELRAITSAPPPDISRWAFAAENDLLFSPSVDAERIPPAEWLQRGHVAMQKSLSVI